MGEDERRALLAGWERAVERSRGWAERGVTARGGAGRNQRAPGRAERGGPVQMAEIKPQRYKDSRPAAYFEKFHERARADRQGGWVYNLARVILTLPTVLVFRTRAIGTENVPACGPGAARPQPLQPDGPLLLRRLPAAQGPLHGQVAALRAARS